MPLFDKHWKKWIRKHHCKLSDGTASLSNYSVVTLEEQTELGHLKIRAFTLAIGAHTLIRSTAKLDFVEQIGRFCSISNDCCIGHEKHTHPVDWVSSHSFQYSKDTPFEYNPTFIPARLGHDIWIGTNVTIMEGVKIGTGAVVATNSLVTKDVPPYAIVGGNPAKIIKYRFPEEVIQGLLASEWWDYPIEVLKTLPLNQPPQFLKELATIPKQQATYQKIQITRQGCKVIS